ncbi:hypothetical protein ACWF94_14905 [Streptomyces sp. NPDC055078]
MPKKQPRDTSFAQVLASLEPSGAWDESGTYSPATAGEFVDEHSTLWTKVRGPLDARLAARLVRSADRMIVGESAGEELCDVPDDERTTRWSEIRKRLDSPDLDTYQAFEFVSGDGDSLLYLEGYC